MGRTACACGGCRSLLRPSRRGGAVPSPAGRPSRPQIRALAGRGEQYEGATPTKPWTGVCLAHRTGQRISGPQYFGFSDALTQRAIAGLYDARELAAAIKVTARQLLCVF